MSQPQITISDGASLLMLDPDLFWSDEFDWFSFEESTERGITGSFIIHRGQRLGGRPITLTNPDDSAAWMERAVLSQLKTWESADAALSLSLRGQDFSVKFRRFDGPPIEARPVEFVADPLPGGFGDFYLTTIRLIEV